MSRAPAPSDRTCSAVTVQVDRPGPLPLVNHVLDRLGLPALLDQHIPTPPARCALAYARGLGVLLRSTIVERAPIYRQQELTRAFTQINLSVLMDDPVPHPTNGRPGDRRSQSLN